jgi:RNA-directed DNA polymerase
MLTGWANYFCLGAVSHAYEAVDAYVQDRLRQWLRRKHKVQGTGYAQYPGEFFYDKLGLVRLTRTQRNLPWAKA